MKRRRKAELVQIWRQTVAALDAGALVEARLRARPPAGPVYLLALGKPAGAMAEGTARALGQRLVGGLVVGPPGTRAPPGLKLAIGSHPEPDRRSLAAGRALLAAARAAPRTALPLVLVAGGGSALAVAPAPGLSGAEKLSLHRALLRSGLGIQDVNALRAHASSLKGGGLLAALGARPVRLEVLSDVGAGEIDAVASGPCSPDAALFDHCLQLVGEQGLRVPVGVRRHLAAGARGERPETLKAGAKLLERVSTHRLAGSLDLLKAAAEVGRAAGFEVVARRRPFAGSWLGVREEIARWVAAAAPARPTLWVAVGEARVALPARSGRGGRAQQLVLSLLPDLAGRPAALLVAGSDGQDASSGFAGGVVDGDSLAQAAALGVDLGAALRRFDASTALSALGAAIPATTPRTNLTDLFLLARDPAR